MAKNEKGPHESSDTFLYKFARFVLQVFSFLVYPVCAHDKDRLDRNAPYLIVANHQSMMDPLLIAVISRRHQIHFIGKSTLRKNAVFNWVLDHLQMISVSRGLTDMRAMRDALKVLQEGRVVGIFPEGTRRRDSMMQNMGSGVGLIALRAQVPVIPIYFAQRPRPLRVTHLYVGDELPYEDIRAMDINKESCELFTYRVRDIIYRMKETAEKQ
ncbi:MAG: lysophospholipid acyltransferase family protein [Eubacteriales bacterium]|jgi:1-acyl-sn-glycerol-3-phosphate acyltransferase|nr:lysophospholipid acyltransferase family protein [Eubacteriales bacterium]MDD4105655.1 lysophospholipid acyltransferase family protein [Eubacteriales bacterium]MDD4711134.1 lysophospholipid acyltransferase family protein [Eubacteriales bacterium]NLO15153.1 1-acyl-sn-glycerol-3-phosphate acyltransferase [Clostridiales bacterium]